ncbi:MAG: hypothetical protein GF317_04045 [Candidatus Lokiarchaeota archaeon]|nr:hypothetical protein [Candidatus Lokiarchaeota archaeon]MBD3199058.1 hypothetical protein [Candidatus Lokiarchaeota archaeon]
MKTQPKIKRNYKVIILIALITGFISGFEFTNIFLLNDDNVTQITIVYSSEKSSWMTIAYTDFLEDWNAKNPNQKIRIDMHPYGSSDSIISILNGEIFPTIWSPASSLWLPFLNTKWQSLKSNIEPIVNTSETVKIIYSPIVIATWEEFNNTHEINGLADIRELNLDPTVNVKMAHTDPRLSNSGFMTTIMATSAASGIDSVNLSFSDLADPNNQQWLREFESSAIMYGKSTGFLSRYMKTGGPDALNIVFLYENLVRDISATSSGGKVIAIYPEEGTLYSDHPFCILNADWVSPDQKIVAESFLSFLNKRDTVETATEFGFRPINSSIPIDPNIFNYENYGISYNLSVPELEVPNSGEVLLKIPDLWLLTKA